MFLKPGEAPDGGLAFDLAPLIIQEVASVGDGTGANEHGNDPVRFGSWSMDGSVEAGRPVFDSDRPAVYWHESRVHLEVSDTTGGTGSQSVEVTDSKPGPHGGDYDQFSYVWWYPAAHPDEPPSPEGFRITVDKDANPLAWEVLTRDGSVRSVYVTESVERRAEARFGGPLPGRNHSVEPSIDDAPDVVVARVLSDGPMPMGPIVYLTASPRKVATLICRCMSSQVDEFEETSYYELLPLDRLLGVGFAPAEHFPFVQFDRSGGAAGDDEVIEGNPSEAGRRTALQRLRLAG